MRTGIVVNNYDPMYKNRIQVRVYGLHTEKVAGQYIILDDDLPWASPAPNQGGNSGSYSVPTVGSRVFVDGSNYNLTYYGQVEVKSAVKKMMAQNADSNEDFKVIAWNETVNSDGGKDFIKIYYHPEKGLIIECNGNSITLTKYDGCIIQSKFGSEIEMTREGDLNISSSRTINLKCDNINITEGALSDATYDRIILGSRLQEIFNNHKHWYSPDKGVLTDPPVDKINENDFADSIRIRKNKDNR